MEATFNDISFAEGRFRTAYMGTWIKPQRKAGKKCVIKEKKDTYAWKSTDWDTTMKIQKKAIELAEGFTCSSSCRQKIVFADAMVMMVSQRPSVTSHPKINEFVIVEDYIPGIFKKWCNNYGYISSESRNDDLAMPAFMHWSWMQSKGELMIADLQGVCSEDGYILTDPAVLSSSNEYGATDMGVEGMAMFFMHHRCNLFCQELPRPTLSDFRENIPQKKLFACYKMMQQVKGTTSYLHELQFSPDVLTLVDQVMKMYSHYKY